MCRVSQRVRVGHPADGIGGTLISAQTLIDKALPWHREMAAIAHEHGKLYLLHTCGNLTEIMPALIENVQLDERSFEDVIEPVTETKQRWGDRISILGRVDVDFLCRVTEEQVRRRVRDILEVCLPGSGYCLGSGNFVANYIR